MNSSSHLSIFALVVACTTMSNSTANRLDIYVLCFLIAAAISYVYSQFELKWYREEQEVLLKIKSEINSCKSAITKLEIKQAVATSKP